MKNIKQIPEKNNGKRGHYIKKKAKESITFNEQEHDEMLKVAKVIFVYHFRLFVRFFCFIRNYNYWIKKKSRVSILN